MPPLLDAGPSAGRLVKGVERIAVLRANLLGDLVMTFPALEALRSAYPSAELVLLGTPMHAELLAGRPGTFADRVEVVPFSRGVRAGGDEDPEALAAFFGRMRREQFDLAVQLHGGGRWSNPFLRRVEARVTAGLCAPDAEPLDRSLPFRHFQHEVLRLLEVAALVGADPTTLTPRLAVTEVDRASSRRVVPEADGPLVVVHPGASDVRRRWPADRFAAVADALVRLGARVVVTGTASELVTAEGVAAAMSEDALVVAGDLALGQLVGLLARAELVLSNDTGPRHLAEAVGTPTVSLFWCGNVGNAAPLTRLRHRIHVSWRLECPRCGTPKLAEVYATRYGRPCDHREPWLTDIDVIEVLPDALDLLAQGTAG
jgi:ADP-heptose:LPS heptosyltransferase